MTLEARSLPPFVAALGAALGDASPVVRKHLTLPDGKVLHAGAFRRLWHRGMSGRIAARLLHLQGQDRVSAEGRFELRNELVPDGRGGVAMLWQRTHRHGAAPVRGVGSLRWDVSRGVLIDSIGARKWLEVELLPSTAGGAVTMTSRRQWMHVAGVRVRLPRILFGSAQTREWEEPDGRLGLSLTLHHPLLGAYAGYEVVLDPEEWS